MAHLVVEIIALRIALHKVGKGRVGGPACLLERLMQLEGQWGQDKDGPVGRRDIGDPLAGKVGAGWDVVVEVRAGLGVVHGQPDRGGNVDERGEGDSSIAEDEGGGEGEGERGVEGRNQLRSTDRTDEEGKWPSALTWSRSASPSIDRIAQ